MTNQEILTKAIQKAIVGGFNPSELEPMYWEAAEDGMELRLVNILIFNHDFAKALWGGGRMPWQYHLQQMVIAEDPIKYLGDTI